MYFEAVFILTIVLVILGLFSFIGGAFCLVRFARTRKRPYLITGLLLTLIVPGVFFCFVVGVGIPSTMIVYGPPPPPTMIVYGPPSDLVP